MKVLVIFSNPADASRLRLDREDRILADLQRQFPQRLELIRRHASDVNDIHALIIEGRYDVIHLSGHGCADGIYLERDDMAADGELVGPQRLLSLLGLAEQQPHLVVLMCCYSADLLKELRLAAPWVIAADCAVRDDACIRFVRGLYEWLLRDNNGVENSFRHAKRLLDATGFDSTPFLLTRRSTTITPHGLVIECRPDLNRDAILVNLDDVEHLLDGFDMPREDLLHLLSRRLTIHYWIFDSERDQATIPIGRSLFGEFRWKNAAEIVRCTKLMKLRTDVPVERWSIWSKILVCYNDLASSEYRSKKSPSDPTNKLLLQRTLARFVLAMEKDILGIRDRLEALGHGDLIGHFEFFIAHVRNAQDQLALERLPQVVAAFEQALTNLHEIVFGLQPPEAPLKREAP